MNSLKEIKATESLYELKQEDRNCQSYGKEVTYNTCTTKYFMEQLRLKCGCLPFAIINATNNKEKVCGLIYEYLFVITYKCKVSMCSSKEEMECLKTTIQKSTPAECLRYNRNLE